jgi:hypothetical protein
VNPLNPEAGDTPAPTDPRELEIGRRAAAVVWRAIPYFGFRYGERGRRFGLSDSSWLVTLATLPAAAALDQITWLAGVLSPRGMPSWLLEVQLEVTARIGTKFGWAGAAALRDGARHLAERRRTVLTDRVFDEAAGAFERVAGVQRARISAGTGRIVASAHADVALGLAPSAAGVVEWLGDRTMFDAAWCDAVARTSALAAEVIRAS